MRWAVPLVSAATVPVVVVLWVHRGIDHAIRNMFNPKEK